MRIERRGKPAGKYKAIAEGRVSSRAVRYSHNDGAPFSLTTTSAEGVSVRVLLTLAEAQQIARDVAQYALERDNPEGFILLPDDEGPGR